MAHILVVDDDGDLRALLKTALERDGHQVSLLKRSKSFVRTIRCPHHRYRIFVCRLLNVL